MHPLITAYWTLREWKAIEPRLWSPYYLQWDQMLNQYRQWIAELERALGH